MKYLGTIGINTVLVEAGTGVTTAFNTLTRVKWLLTPAAASPYFLKLQKGRTQRGRGRPTGDPRGPHAPPSPIWQVTNAFGHVLEEKLVAEKYLRKSGLDYTIVRPGGLKADPPTGALYVAPENSLNAGEVSRDLVADVAVAAVFDAKAKNKVVEIVESDKDGNAKNGVFNGLKM